MSIDLSGKTALVTGASRGIGRACALKLAQVGASLVLAGRNQPQLEAVASEVRSLGREALPLLMDVRSTESVEAAFEKARQVFPSIDILVNNAGIAHSAPFQRWTDRDWAEVFEVNVNGVFRCSRAVLPIMQERRWGRIVNIASVAGKAGAAYITGYAASKHAVLGLTKALAVEVAERGITVNAVCPGYVETDMAMMAIKTITEKTKLNQQQALEYLRSQTPQKRLFQVDEVAALVVYLCSEAAAGINGQAINICGGALPY
ncbi:MAG: SDR family NAD(P)-dependent oxidoreductase [Acidobacteriota bacterium]|nr:SDR family oxidoreductase [Blastocatellia bacterium]MDW8413660.1 SDR family NAD(P)-dependent oxidoreductase [Acidobacteriota bacterium]